MGKEAPFRRKILTLVGGLIVLSVLGSTLSLYRITEVNDSLDRVNQTLQPLNRWMVQMKADTDTLKREWGRESSSPLWVVEVLATEWSRAVPLISSGRAFSDAEQARRWNEWTVLFSNKLQQLRSEIKSGVQNRATLEEFNAEMEWGVQESDRLSRQFFSQTERRVNDLKTGLQIVLGVIVGLSLLLLWLGERALRPLQDLIRWVRLISDRGLAKEAKSLLPDFSLSRNDEVSTLAREFHRMATHLLEWEKQVESQSHRLQEQNRMLKELSTLNRNVLASMQSILVVTDLAGKVSHCNSAGLKWLESSSSDVVGQHLLDLERLRLFLGVEMDEIPARIEPREFEGKTIGGMFYPLRHDNGEPCGWVLSLDDLSDQVEIQKRLQAAEQLAAVGRLSAQVAHEVRNPLHAIGLEAELAMEGLARQQNSVTKSSLQSILQAVDRLEKITQSYLRFSKLSSGKSKRFLISDLIEAVLAQYTSLCEHHGVQVDWSLGEMNQAALMGDFDLWMQALGNLLQNSVQAGAKQIEIHVVNAPGEWVLNWMDDGPGVPESVREKIFQPFVTSKANGTGLGLPLVQKIVHESGGSIQYLDRLTGGACFRMALPREAVAEANA